MHWPPINASRQVDFATAVRLTEIKRKLILIGVFSSEIDKCGPEWAGRHGDDETAHLDLFPVFL
jgi:hypothetical protein